ncbi:MAG: hypothetical protein L0Y44_04900 [Phycisphaerales bacterium]|nr:hypothetical protein [Phycisphaerales bacterium]MCI0629975.1 hypothetical protein [Phycisphaerales bacterium]MCI0677293.1 hypothetical protein [Phycisphaerales bacterium]
MFKFLRRYNKMLLAVFGVLLMITFLIPQAIDQLGKRAGSARTTLATLDDGVRFTGADEARAQQELGLIEKLSRANAGIPPIVRIIREPEHWFLLSREAEAAGLVGTGSSSVPQEAFDQLASILGGGDPDLVRDTIAKVDGVGRLINLYVTGDLHSDQRLRKAARRYMHSVGAQMVVLEAKADQSELQPSEEQVTQQMEKYADVLPGEGDRGFGYKLPDRVKLEWLTVSADSVRKLVEASKEFDAVAQRVHWRRNASDPLKRFPPISEAAAIPEVVRSDLLEKLTQQKLDEITKYATDQLRLNQRGIPEKDGYLELPADWEQRKLSLAQLATAIQTKFGVELPAYQAAGDRWLSIEDVSKLEGIGQASTEKFGNTRLGATQLVQSAKELGESGASMIRVQKDIAGPPLTGFDQSIYIFRVIGAELSRRPSSIDEVREAVVADLKRESHYEKLKQAASELERKAESEGLLALAMEHGTAVQSASVGLTDRSRVQQRLQYGGMPVGVEPSPLPVIGRHRKTNEAIIDYALESLPTDVPLDTVAEELRVLTTPVDDRLAVAVVRITRQDPLTQERYVELAQRNVIQRLLASDDERDVTGLLDAFSFAALSKRHQFTRVREDEKAAEEATPAKASAEGAAKAGL